MNTTNNSEKPLIGDALGFAFSSIFERGILGFLKLIAIAIAMIAVPVALWFCLGMINQLTGFDFFSTSFTERADGTWAPPIPYFILSTVWIYVIAIPSFQCMLLSFYDNNALQRSLLSLFAPRKTLSFLMISLPLILFIEITRYLFYPAEFLTSHYNACTTLLNPIYFFTFSLNPDPVTLIIQFILYFSFITSSISAVSRFMFAGYYIIDKNNGPLEALRASWNLTRGKASTVFGLAITMIAIFTLSTPGSIFGLLNNPNPIYTILVITIFALATIIGLLRWLMIGLMSTYAYRRLEK